MLCADCAAMARNPTFLTLDFEHELKASAAGCTLSARAGCELCLFLVSYLFTPDDYEVRTFGTRVDFAGPLRIHHRSKQGANVSDVVSELAVSIDRANSKFDVWRWVEVCAGEDDPLVRDPRITGRAVAPDSSSMVCMTRVTNMLAMCEMSHPMCHPQAAEPVLPWRVLDLSSLNGICLQETEGLVTARYIALSHCWGPLGSSRCVTNTGNLAKMRVRIDLEEMTPVFQNAVQLSRHLGIQYLWIDALCIIQDSPSDWATEAAKMASIYQNATLTIVASSSPNGGVPFLRARPTDYLEGAYIPYYSKEINQHGMLFLRRGVDNEQTMRKHLDEPIESRAWCLQERVLSTRAVYYDTEQFLWECNAGHFPENTSVSKDLTAYHPRWFDDRVMLRSANLKVALEEEKIASESKGFREDKPPIWYELLRDYCRRRLTYRKDMLTALSGVARLCSDINKDTYLAGIWQNDLHVGLLWRYHRVEQKQPVRDEHVPSWSWASIWDPADTDNAPVLMQTFRLPGNREHDAKLLEADIQLMYNDPFGQVTSGALHLQALTRDLWTNLDSRSPEGSVHLHYTSTGCSEPMDHFEKLGCAMLMVGWLDGDGDLPTRACGTDDQGKAIDFTALLLSEWRGEYRVQRMLQGLLLVPGKDGRYVRRGIFEITSFEEGLGDATFAGTWSEWHERKIVII